jgi:hypothetical protein
MIFKSSSTSSIHLLRYLPLFLVPSILVVIIFLGILSLVILSICPHHLNLGDFINFTLSAPSNISSISLFVLILQLSPSFMEPYYERTMECKYILIEIIEFPIEKSYGGCQYCNLLFCLCPQQQKHLEFFLCNLCSTLMVMLALVSFNQKNLHLPRPRLH